ELGKQTPRQDQFLSTLSQVLLGPNWVLIKETRHDKKAYLDQRQLKPNTTSSIRTLPPPSRLDHLCNRYCGGSHTVITAQQRVARVGHFQTSWGPQAIPLSEGTVRGTDGKVYRAREMPMESPKSARPGSKGEVLQLTPQKTPSNLEPKSSLTEKKASSSSVKKKSSLEKRTSSELMKKSLEKIGSFSSKRTSGDLSPKTDGSGQEIVLGSPQKSSSFDGSPKRMSSEEKQGDDQDIIESDKSGSPSAEQGLEQDTGPLEENKSFDENIQEPSTQKDDAGEDEAIEQPIASAEQRTSRQKSTEFSDRRSLQEVKRSSKQMSAEFHDRQSLQEGVRTSGQMSGEFPDRRPSQEVKRTSRQVSVEFSDRRPSQEVKRSSRQMSGEFPDRRSSQEVRRASKQISAEFPDRSSLQEVEETTDNTEEVPSPSEHVESEEPLEQSLEEA
ncbi:hypothetical protein L9F63_027360, partial [Diploptera punctata]